MGDNGSVWLPDAMSTLAGEVDALFWFVFWASTIIFAMVIVAKVYFMVKFRRTDETYVPEPVEESKVLEAVWIVLPTILTLIVFTWGFEVFVKLNTAPPDSYEISVRAQQWSWEFQYQEGAVSYTEMYVPVGRPVKLVMNSSDVLHSFFVPDFRIKHDVIPNRYTSVWFEATQAGEYDIYCTEYCGTQHSGMMAKVVAVPQDEFNKWIAEQSQDLPPAELGLQVYAQCQACHSVDGSAGIGPTLAGLYGTTRPLADGSTVVADEDYLLESIVNPMAKIAEGYQPVMPAMFSSTLSPKQLDGLVAYIKTLE
ncbi:MAG: cytochrome c oxidase subunit II [Bacteroidetes bacterium]|nr:cytochrome c oxidase subunit II [Bacteroidota bacterium]MDA1333055.1 cytochrome c oxidase subunit II [Bacteroidota bacterium]